MTDRTEPTIEELAALSMPADIKEMSRRHHLEAFFHALWDEAQRMQRNHSAEYDQQTGLPLTGDQQ
jgi:predicted metalloprotease with PDZ domain